MLQLCVFCYNNGEHEQLVRSHNVHDSKGRTLCPKLRIYVCEICGKDGDEAHTIKYCKQKRIITQEDTEKLNFKRVRTHTRSKYNPTQATTQSLQMNRGFGGSQFFAIKPTYFEF